MFESHFQTFTDSADKSKGAARLAELRAELGRRGLDGFLIPRSDEHQNEYVPLCAERLAWLTGFTGSAGMAIVLQEIATILVDGRYTLQVRDQVDVQAFEPLNSSDVHPDHWLEKHLRAGMRIAYDPWLHTPSQVARYQKAVEAAGATLVATAPNPVDAIWHDRPAPPLAPIRLHPEKFAGKAAAAKLAHVQKHIGKAHALVLSDPHSIAWIFNIRGSDVAHTPIALCFALVPHEGRATIFVDHRKVNEELRSALHELVDFAAPDALIPALENYARDKALLRFDAATAPVRLVQAFEAFGGKAEVAPDPTANMKARKTKAELRGMRAAHRRDGVAVTQFLCWLAREAPKGKQTEITATQALETFRRATKKLKDISFPTISGMGPNGAIVHYRVTQASDRKLSKGLFLIDSGAQYEDGTTDITRTIAIGKPSVEMRDRYTRVLKGHIAIVTSTFPHGISGAQLDSFARRALWDVGLDFDHGTGHGVGSYLSVHEGPQRISKLGHVALEPGMVLSNEPGYYKTNAYGIRLENLIVVEERKISGAERKMLGFENLTLAPFDLALVEPKLLSDDELRWLNSYHARVRKELSPKLDATTRKWLAAATKAVKR
jgi:Xaa-Pro aminopeptidase